MSNQKVKKIFLEMSMGNHFANRKWSCHLENCDCSGYHNHHIHFWSHLKLSPDKRLYLVFFFWLKSPFCFGYHGFADTLILTTGLEMNKDAVVCPYDALLIKIKVAFIRTLTRLKYLTNIHSVSFRTFVQCKSYRTTEWKTLQGYVTPAMESERGY